MITASSLRLNFDVCLLCTSIIYDLFDRNRHLSRSHPHGSLRIEVVVDHNYIDLSIMCGRDMISEIWFELIPIFYNALASEDILCALWKYMF